MKLRNRAVALLIFLCLSGITARANNPFRYSFREALQKKVITVEGASTGGLNLLLCVQNNTDRKIVVEMDPALIFNAAEENYQHMVLAGGETLTLQPRADDTLHLKAFCGKSNARSPRKDLRYQFWKQGDKVMIHLARFIRDHKLQGSYIAQHAVWALTNNHSLSNIYSASDVAVSQQLMTKMAGWLKVPVPDYFNKVHIRHTADNRMLVTRPERVDVYLDWQDVSPRNMYVTILREDGTVCQQITSELIDQRGHHVKVQFDPRNMIPGIYYVRLRDDDNKVWQLKTVRIEPV